MDVSTSPGKKGSEEDWNKWRPEFSKYDVVSNYNGQMWPGEVRTAFINYVKNGGGFVVVHAANNAFSMWPEYNEMIGLGGWVAGLRRAAPMSISRTTSLSLTGPPGAEVAMVLSTSLW